MFSGKTKIEFGRRLTSDWQGLADYFEIPPADRARFERGREPQGVWEWLEDRTRLPELREALRVIEREDLLEELVELNTLEEGQEQAWQHYYHECLRRWSDPRYALDTRFVQLTLLVDQGEDTQGPRWQASSEKFQDLREVLDRAPEQAIVLLGPPGSGKSTLLRHFELDCARAALDGNAGHSITSAPLTFFIQLNDYKAKTPHDPMLPSPQPQME